MANRSAYCRYAALLIILTGIFWVSALPHGPALAQEPEDEPAGSVEYCLSCHANPDLSLALPSGEVLSLHISPEDFTHSVHSDLNITCQTCHPQIETYPHPDFDFDSAREVELSYYEACRRCHEINYTETLDSIHADQLAAGNQNAPVCTDCHGTHYVQDPDEPRAQVALICGQCHSEVLDEFEDSVHGAALINVNNPDVPVCTDCHGVHDIHDPRTEFFRVESPELCAGCHANPQLMGQYGLSSNVYDTYRLSWHGVDVTVFQARWPTLWHQSAVCTDCHGVHDILPTEHPLSHVHPDNLLGTCQQCHETAGPMFVSAWTGHFPISQERTPFVFYTQVFYDSFAYVVLWISAIYVLLQIVRATVARVRRSL